MVKPLAFKGDKKSKKRKHPNPETSHDPNSKNALTTIEPKASTTEEDDSWVSAEAASDITGPILFALPSATPTCIACDTNGKVFTSEIENIFEADLATAEPHDVRQVWVANHVAGTDGISFKGHHGRYLSCDKFGILSATREAISFEESFTCIPTPDIPGAFSIQTQRADDNIKFLTLSSSSDTTTTNPHEVRGDAETTSPNTTIRIRMQARFKPRLKANKESKAREKISRKALEEVVGRRLDDEEVRRLKRARREGDYHEVILDVRVKGKHDKFAS
ncbi:hypothetical protein MMC09_004563 [Bachmanniomyces sp. S44760]|nr:hypothetical protein [Bachmanniomyces sp. S44760]